MNGKLILHPKQYLLVKEEYWLKYIKDKELVLEEILNEGEMIIQFYGIHEYEILNDVIVIENKEQLVFWT